MFAQFQYRGRKLRRRRERELPAATRQDFIAQNAAENGVFRITNQRDRHRCPMRPGFGAAILRRAYRDHAFFADDGSLDNFVIERDPRPIGLIKQHDPHLAGHEPSEALVAVRGPEADARERQCLVEVV